MYLRRLIDVTKKTSFWRCIWDVLKTSQKRRLFWDVSERSLRCLSQRRSIWDISDTSHAGWVVCKSNSEKCWITDYINEERASKVILYFAKTLSEHIDPILPVPFSNLDDDIEITAFVPGNDVFPGIDIRLLSWKACLALSCKLGWK